MGFHMVYHIFRRTNWSICYQKDTLFLSIIEIHLWVSKRRQNIGATHIVCDPFDCFERLILGLIIEDVGVQTFLAHNIQQGAKANDRKRALLRKRSNEKS